VEKKYKQLKYQINTIIFIMTYIFISYIFDIIDISTFLNKLGQTLYHLASNKSYMHYIMARIWSISLVNICFLLSYLVHSVLSNVTIKINRFILNHMCKFL
jgi:hypothetical protein